MAAALAQEEGLSEEERQLAQLAALLHDVADHKYRLVSGWLLGGGVDRDLWYCCLKRVLKGAGGCQGAFPVLGIGHERHLAA